MGSIISSREATVTVTTVLKKYDADYFRRAQTNQTTSFFYAFGSKVGGNWSLGKSGAIYIPSCVFASNPSVEDQDGLAVISFELKTFVDDAGNGEIYLGFV
jgi:hypothetical protein